ncbi:sugar kinase [Nocardioides sp. HM23]|uniref:carbohydrate kinase family protein n=1 Tax=Nocardioides bizhenqiangii TaxID=3095076 RepID=UPI002ACAFC17|nr:sugar kinase [Nocardioides sp. HM23]MDZ5620894.1 sugar kinase [Nocardioides sp. HM23]
MTQPTKVVCIGVHVLDIHVATVDTIPEGSSGALVDTIRMSPAGTAGGTAIVLSKLGAEVTSVAAIGDDPIGKVLVELLRANGVDTARITTKHDVQTSASVLPINGDGDRPAWHCIGANGSLTLEDIDLDLVRSADHVHVGGPEFLGDAAVAVLEAARGAGVTTSVDMLAPGEPMWLDAIVGCLPLVDLFLPNDEQLLGLTATTTLEDGAQALLDKGVGCVAVTAGARGAYVATVDETGWVPAFEIEVVDTTGCGDSFSAGFLLGRANGRDLVAAATLGNATAAQVAQGMSTDAGSYDLASVDSFATSTPTR